MTTDNKGKAKIVRSIRNALAPHPFVARDRPWSGFASQAIVVALMSLLYFGVRMVTKDSEIAAFANAANLISFEQGLGIDVESWLQNLILDKHNIVTLFNWIYIWLHWPVILFSMFYLFRYRRSHYILFRNAMIISGAIGLIIFMAYPVAPPRFMGGFEDTVGSFSTSYKILQPPSIVNKYAALPSFHVGWNVMACTVLFKSTKFLPMRIFAVVSPLLMAFAVIFTANHWVVDGILGTAIALFGIYGAQRFHTRTHGNLASFEIEREGADSAAVWEAHTATLTDA